MVKNQNLKNKDLLTTVVIATYNGEAFIESQVKSIFQQTVLPDEILIVDDGSTDNTLSILKILKRECPSSCLFKIISNVRNEGYIKNFINGIKKANGDIVFLCDQDDIWLPNKIEYTMNIFSENKYVYAIHSNTSIMDVDGNIIQKNAQNYNDSFKNVELKEFVKKVNYPGMALAFRKNLIIPMLEIVINYRINLPTHDWVICFLACLDGGLYIISKELTLRRYTGENVALNVDKKNISNINNRIEGINLYLKYYEFLYEYKSKIDTNMNLDVKSYINNSFIRMYYLKKKSMLLFFKNIKNVKYYPSFKSFVADAILILSSRKSM